MSATRLTENVDKISDVDAAKAVRRMTFEDAGVVHLKVSNRKTVVVRSDPVSVPAESHQVTVLLPMYERRRIGFDGTRQPESGACSHHVTTHVVGLN